MGRAKTWQVIGVLTLAFALFAMGSLLWYDPRDPSFFSYGGGRGARAIANIGGRWGAAVAGDLFGLLGIGAVFVPPLLGALGWAALRGRRWEGMGWTLTGLLLFLPTMSLTATLVAGWGGSLWPRPLVAGPGGFVGTEIVRILSGSIGTFGLLLLALTGFLLTAVCVSHPSLPTPPPFLLALPATVAGLFRALSVWMEKRRAERGEETVRIPLPGVRRLGGGEEGGEGMGEEGLAGEHRGGERGETEQRPYRVVTPGPVAQSRSGREGRGQQAFPFLVDQEGYHLPPLSLLDAPVETGGGGTKEEWDANSQILERKLQDFGVEGRVTEVQPGPVITRYEIEPAPGIKINKIVALADDLALALKALSVRVVAPIPGKAVVGVEIPNRERATVFLKEVLTSPEFQSSSALLPLAVGKDIGGHPYVTDLGQMPHLLIAGTTGSGKSVCINSLILSILYRATPREVRFLLIDPKRVELSLFNGIPHLADRVVYDAKDAAKRLMRVVAHMEERYKIFAEVGARNIAAYNRLVGDRVSHGEKGENGGEGAALLERRPLPYLVVIIDELADLMLMAAADVENAVARLAQMARAVGIHLIVATQRPSVDVITGVIKANFSARISFQVSSKVDSRTVLDMNGAEHLLGHGDMLFIPPGSSKPIRIHGSFVSEVEMRRVVEFLATQGRVEEFPWNLLPHEVGPEEGEAEGGDPLYGQAMEIVVQTRQASISLLQRRLRVGFNRAARLIERMEREGVVSPMDGPRPREVLVERTAP